MEEVKKSAMYPFAWKRCGEIFLDSKFRKVYFCAICHKNTNRDFKNTFITWESSQFWKHIKDVHDHEVNKRNEWHINPKNIQNCSSAIPKTNASSCLLENNVGQNLAPITTKNASLELPINNDKTENDVKKIEEIPRIKSPTRDTETTYDEYDCISKYVSNEKPEDFVETIVLSDSEDVVIDWFAVCDDSSDEEEINTQNEASIEEDEHASTALSVPSTETIPSTLPFKNLAVTESNNELQRKVDDNYEQQIQQQYRENGEKNSPYSTLQHNIVKDLYQRQHNPELRNSSEESLGSTSPYLEISPGMGKRKQSQENLNGVCLKFAKKQQMSLQPRTKFISKAIPPPKQRKQQKEQKQQKIQKQQKQQKIQKQQKEQNQQRKKAPKQVKETTSAVPKVTITKTKTTPDISSEYEYPTTEYLCMECARPFKTERARDTHYNRTHLGTTANAWKCVEKQKLKNQEANKKLAIKKELKKEMGIYEEFSFSDNCTMITENQSQFINEAVPQYPSSHQGAPVPISRRNYTSGYYTLPQTSYSSEHVRSNGQLHNIQLSLQLQSLNYQDSGNSFPSGHVHKEPPQQIPTIIGYQPHNYLCHQPTMQPAHFFNPSIPGNIKQAQMNQSPYYSSNHKQIPLHNPMRYS